MASWAGLLEHNYGENIYILDSPVIESVLTSFSVPQSKLPILNEQIQMLYEQALYFLVNEFFDVREVNVDTRMKALNAKAVLKSTVVDSNQKAVIISLARAGIFPSHICLEKLHQFLNPENLRQDHFYLNRKVNEQGQVIGVDVSGSKIGGDIENAHVILPDPMGATGGSISYVIDHFKNQVEGKARSFYAVHLIITPEYIKRIQQDHPDVKIIALRLDRALSSEKALNSLPGTYSDEEVGLNESQYIVPGAGGVGEILNNSFC